MLNTMRHKNFYRDNYRIMVRVLVGALILAMVLLGIIFFLMGRDRTTYYTTNDIGTVLPLRPLPEPPANPHFK